jgi:hypothetical protein
MRTRVSFEHLGASLRARPDGQLGISLIIIGSIDGRAGAGESRSGDPARTRAISGSSGWMKEPCLTRVPRLPAALMAGFIDTLGVRDVIERD